jgi:hypothetical protein
MMSRFPGTRDAKKGGGRIAGWRISTVSRFTARVEKPDGTHTGMGDQQSTRGGDRQVCQALGLKRFG